MEHDFPVEILTKSALVTRDSDIIEKFDQVEVGMTITSNDDKVRRAFEPGTSLVTERLEALKLYSNIGIPTFAFLGPLLPFLSELELEKLMNVLSDRVGRVLVDRLNIKAGNWNNIEQTLVKYYPEMLKDFKEASKDPSEYYTGLKTKVRRMLDERAIPYDILY